MGLIIIGIILFIVGKIAKVKILETIGKIMAVAGVVLWGLSLVGIVIPLPFGL